MQRYRVNYGLLIGLVVGTLVIGGGVFVLHGIQAARNADGLIVQADKAQAAGDLRDEAGYLYNYIQLRPDDVAVAERHANLRADIGRLPDASPTERQVGYQALEQFIQKNPSNKEVRRRLVDLLASGRSWVNALVHIEYLLNSDPKNAELIEMRLNGLLAGANTAKAIDYGFKVVGYNKISEEFEEGKALVTDRPGTYSRLAYAVRDKRRDPEVAEAIMRRLVELNPESADAHLAFGRYLSREERDDEANAEVDRALELSPENVEVLLAKAQLIIASASDLDPEDDKPERDARFEEAYAILIKASKLASSDRRVFDYLARLERQRGDNDAALAHYDTGIESVEEENPIGALELRFAKARAQIDFSDIDGARETIEELSEAGLRQEFIDYLNARIGFINGEWFKSSETLVELRPAQAFVNMTDIGVELNTTLGLCYERLGQFDRALGAYRQALQLSPANDFARASVSRMEQRQGNRDIDEGPQAINIMVAEEFRKPQEEQDWAPIFAAIDNLAVENDFTSGEIQLIKAEIYLKRGDYKEARSALNRARKEFPDDLRVWRLALRVMAADKDKGPTAALKALDTVVEKFGDTPLLRLDRADLMLFEGGDDLAQRLLALADGVDDWARPQQVQFWKGLAEKFRRTGDAASRELCLEKITALAPDELPTLIALFSMAIQENDPDRVDEAQQKVLKLVGTKEHEIYQQLEATRLLWEFGRTGDQGLIDQADRLVEQALLKRKDSSELLQLRGRIALIRGDRAGGLVAFDLALSKGPANRQALLIHIGLLLEQGRYADAARVLEKVDKPVRQALLGRTYAEILLNTGAIDEALDSAKKVVERAPENGLVQLWQGQFLLRVARKLTTDLQTGKVPSERKQAVTNQRDGAMLQVDEAFAAAVELAPANPDVWRSRVAFLVDSRKPLQAEQVLRQAQLALPEDQLPSVVAQGYEWVGRWFDAETVYRREYDRDPDNLAAAQALATFYLSPRYPAQKGDGVAKAMPLLNTILREAAGDPEVAKSPTARWARREAAQLLADSGDYKKLLDALKLIEQNTVDGVLPEADHLLKARTLAKRPEPGSRREAISIFEEVQARHVLEQQDDVELGRLYSVTGQWDAARQQMLGAISRRPSIAAPRATFIQMLLRNGEPRDIEDANRQLNRLQAIDPTSGATLQLVVRVAVRLGKQREALQALAKLVPRDLKTASSQQLIGIAQLLTELGDLDQAERLYRAASTKNPAAVLLLADFLGSRRSVEQCFELLDRVADTLGLPAAIQSGVVTVTARRSEVGDRFDPKIQGWLDRALREDPESIPQNLQLASFLEVQRRYDEAIKTYRWLLDQPELEGTQRAVVLNNLSYRLALSSDSQSIAEQALGYIAEAVDLLGPQSDILDTRAVVQTTLGRYGPAIEDLELAITDNPTPAKYFHKARAHMLAGEAARARESFETAQKLGLTRENIAIGEQEQFDWLQEKVDRLTRSAAAR